MQVKKGNAIILKILAKDSEGNVLTDLATATAVSFMVKIAKIDADVDAVISKALLSGLTIDDPSEGYIKIILTSSDTNIEVKKYCMALQITYSADDVQEINLMDNGQVTDVFKVYQDIIR